MNIYIYYIYILYLSILSGSWSRTDRWPLCFVPFSCFAGVVWVGWGGEGGRWGGNNVQVQSAYPVNARSEGTRAREYYFIHSEGVQMFLTRGKTKLFQQNQTEEMNSNKKCRFSANKLKNQILPWRKRHLC